MNQGVLDTFPTPFTSVSGFENIFTDEEEVILNNLIITYNKQADAKIVVVTINGKINYKKGFDNLTL